MGINPSFALLELQKIERRNGGKNDRGADLWEKTQLTRKRVGEKLFEQVEEYYLILKRKTSRKNYKALIQSKSAATYFERKKKAKKFHCSEELRLNLTPNAEGVKKT